MFSNELSTKMESSFRKVVQKKTYDVLSHKYGLILVILGIFGLGISAFHFGEVNFRKRKT